MTIVAYSKYLFFYRIIDYSTQVNKKMFLVNKYNESSLQLTS